MSHFASLHVTSLFPLSAALTVPTSTQQPGHARQLDSCRDVEQVDSDVIHVPDARTSRSSSFTAGQESQWHSLDNDNNRKTILVVCVFT
jgi:hypothetical protein